MQTNPEMDIKSTNMRAIIIPIISNIAYGKGTMSTLTTFPAIMPVFSTLPEFFRGGLTTGASMRYGDKIGTWYFRLNLFARPAVGIGLSV
mmetsp:Transcript_26293/g.44368  ORF Transcript_26293/g.44368 Transcript_26293/m.44368 type:complete len:90 (-) Transcript_26293:1188-1457(-)